MRTGSINQTVNQLISALGWTASGFSLGLLYKGTSPAAAGTGLLLGALLGATYTWKTRGGGN